MSEVNERIRASMQRMKARKLGLAKFMFLRADCRGLNTEAAEAAWDELDEADRKRLVRYADAAMSGLSVDYSRRLGCDRFAPETTTPAGATHERLAAGSHPGTSTEPRADLLPEHAGDVEFPDIVAFLRTLKGYPDRTVERAALEAARLLEERTRERDEAREHFAHYRERRDHWQERALTTEARAAELERLLEEVVGALERAEPLVETLHSLTPRGEGRNIVWRTIKAIRQALARAKSVAGKDQKSSQGCGDELIGSSGGRVQAAPDGATEARHSAGRWLLVYISQSDGDLIVGHSPEFGRVIDGLFGEDNGLRCPKGLQPGLYRVAPAHLWEDEDQIELEGEWQLVISASAAVNPAESGASSPAEGRAGTPATDEPLPPPANQEVAP